MLICASSASTGSPCVRSCASDCPPACKARCSPWPTSSSKPPSTVSHRCHGASSAAFNIEIIAYYVLNSFSQACATFTGQNYGAKRIGRCKRVLGICILEDFIATAVTIASCCSSAIVCWRCSMRHRRSFSVGLHQTRHGVLRLHVQHAVRGHVRISARLRHLTGAGAAHRNRRGRRAHHLDRVRVPRASHVRGHHDRLTRSASPQPPYSSASLCSATVRPSDLPLNLKRVRLAAVHERGDSPGQSAGKNPFRERARLGERTMVGEG